MLGVYPGTDGDCASGRGVPGTGCSAADPPWGWHSPEHSLDFLVATASEQLLPKPICAIKVDVQGSEFRALRGLNETLHKHRPVLYYEHDWRFVRHPLMHSPTRWLQQT